jgi:hypothetical protein
MSARIILIVALVLAGCVAPTSIFGLKEGTRISAQWLQKKISMQELEQRFEAERVKILPESLAEWARFQKSFSEGCEVWDIQDSAFKAEGGFTGYAIIRDGKVVDVMGAFMTKKEPNQPLQRNASTGSVSNLKSPARRG